MLSILCKSREKLLVLCTSSRVGRSFVGETEQHLFVSNAMWRRICALHQWVGKIDSRGQFHQHVNVYLLRSKIPHQHKKDSQVKQLFALSRPALVKAACKHVDEIDPWASSPRPNVHQLRE